MLVNGPDYDTCRLQVERFFARTILVKYDSVQVIAEKSCNGADPDFQNKLEAGLIANQSLAAELLAELKDAGLTDLNKLVDLPQGYASKTLHTMAHLLDGFFGVDSRFYNLNDDSHRLSDTQMKQLAQSPGSFWMLHVEASSDTGNVDQVGLLRNTPSR